MIKEKTVWFWLFVSYVVFQAVALILIGHPATTLCLLFALYPLSWVGKLNKKTLLLTIVLFLVISGLFAYLITLLAALPLIVLCFAVYSSALVVPYFVLFLLSGIFIRIESTNKS